MSEAEQQAVVEFLSDPAAHVSLNGGTAAPVEIITTHASIVFLAGGYAL